MKNNNKTIFINSTKIKIRNPFIQNKNISQKQEPIKIVNLCIDNIKRRKLLNEDDVKLYIYTHRLFNQSKIDINKLKRIRSFCKIKNKTDKSLFNCYNFLNKNYLSTSKNLSYFDSEINRIDNNMGFYSDRNKDKKKKLLLKSKSKNIKKKLIRLNFLSEKALDKININDININLPNLSNKKENIYFLPYFNTLNNIASSKLKNEFSISFPYRKNNFNLYEKDFMNIAKTNYSNSLTEKNNINTQSDNDKNFITENNNIDSIKKIRNIRIISMKEKMKLFPFNGKRNEVLYNKSPPNFYDIDKYFYYNIYPENCGWLVKKCFEHRIKWKECHSLNTNIFNFKWKEVALTNDFIDYNNKEFKQMINHYEYNSCITNKYNLFLNFTNYCENQNIEVFKYIPFTIILDESYFDDPSYFLLNFKIIFNNINKYIFENKSIRNQTFDRRKINYKTYFPLKQTKLGGKTYVEIPSTHYAGKNLWIVKAPNLNRGRCIQVFNNYDKIIKYINEIIRGNVGEYDNIKEEKENKEFDKNDEVNMHKYKSNKIIIQKYIEKPLLYNGRKFDIRIWVLLTHKMTAYMFKEGHLKLSSINYDLDSNNSFIHLTNYSLQKYNKYFSKYEKGNEVSFETFQNYINEISKKSINFKEMVFPQFREIIKHSIKCSKNLINLNSRKNCFEIMGYDFLLDEDFNAFLIEINSNPGLEISSEIIKMLVPRMIDDALRLTVDDIFETFYDKEWVNEKGEYSSKFHVKGYNDEENMWEYICDLNDRNINSNINEKNHRKNKFKIKKNHKKKSKIKKI